VPPTHGPARDLARRLWTLRKGTWPGRRITQKDLAEAFGVSVPSISAWENQTQPTIPPPHRLEAYATFFATERSVSQTPFRVLPRSHLTGDEQARHDTLLRELIELSSRAHSHELEGAEHRGDDGDLWRFPPDQDITFVCSALPESRLELLPYTDPGFPDYVEAYRYADLDALLELHGHVRAANPDNDVHIKTPADMTADDYSTHLVLLGGVDWNTVTAELLHRHEVPVRQLLRATDAEPGGFEVVEGERRRSFSPELREENGRPILVSDVAHFYRAPNSFNDQRTVTICNGMYQRGTLGVVRALTDRRFRDRNVNYVRSRFAGSKTFSIVSRVQVIDGSVVTPDWTKTKDRLHEWPKKP
jgi:transcriptional regulator with XRE-family HTH domain